MANITGLAFAYGDLYPDYTVTAATDMTSLSANPDKDDLEALNEDGDAAEKADVKSPRSGMIFLAILMVVAMVVFLGVQ